MRDPAETRRSLLCSLLAALFAFCASPVAATDWPQFRGPNCSGISSSDDEPLPVKFSSTENVLWQAEVGDGIGSPVVADGRVFTAGVVDKGRVGLFAFEAATGRPLWKRIWEIGPQPEMHQINSHSSSTPAADSERVYFYLPSLGLFAIDAQTGDDRWHCPLPVPYFVFKWGPGMSPVLFRDQVLFCQDDDLNPALYAIDKRTGRVLWKDDRSDMAVNYSHPVICETESGPEIVVAGTGMLIGYEPTTGRRKWFARVLLRNIKTTPVVRDGVVYISLQSAGIANQWLATADMNSDGKLTKAEIQGFVGEVKVPDAFMQRFDRGDANGDGFLEGEELDRAFLSPDNFAGPRHHEGDRAEQYILAVRGGGEGDVTKTHVLWKHESRAPDHICSPLVVGDRMLVIKGGGIAGCFLIGDGSPAWNQKRIGNAGEYFASPITGDGKVYVAGENGTIVVLRSGGDFELLSLNDMRESIIGTPAISDGRLFIRTRTRLYAVAD